MVSSFSETFNIALVEAASSGKPILASDIPVFHELSQNGQYFTFFKTGDALDFYEKLKIMIETKDQRSTANQARYYQDRFNYKNFVKQLNEFYQLEKTN